MNKEGRWAIDKRGHGGVGVRLVVRDDLARVILPYEVKPVLAFLSACVMCTPL